MLNSSHLLLTEGVYCHPMNTNIRTMTVDQLGIHCNRLVEAQVMALPGKARVDAVNATRAAYSELRGRTSKGRMAFLRLQAI